MQNAPEISRETTFFRRPIPCLQRLSGLNDGLAYAEFRGYTADEFSLHVHVIFQFYTILRFLFRKPCRSCESISFLFRQFLFGAL